jgi:cytochrome c-type biogenesis protein CcmH/NrfG
MFASGALLRESAIRTHTNTPMRIVVTALLLLVATVIGRAADASPSSALVQECLKRCIAHYERGDLAGAIVELKKALQLEPQNSHLQFMMGNALYRSKDIRGAASAYEKAVLLRPSHLEAHISRGFSLFELKEFKDAAVEWSTAVRLNPNEPFARAAWAVGLYSIGEVEDAKAQYAVAVAMDRRYGDASAIGVDIRWSRRAVEMLTRIDGLIRQKEVPEDLGRSIIMSSAQPVR